MSKSTISTGLSNLLTIGHVKKEKIIGSRQYQYFISSSYIESMNNAFGRLDHDVKFFSRKLFEMENKFTSEYAGYKLLKSRIEELIEVYGLYHEIIDRMDEKIESKNIVLEKLTEEEIRNIDLEFHDDIKQIEDEILDFFLYESVYSTINELTLRVYVYFITRKVLTQKKLKELTGLSVGKISQIINFLLKYEMIEKLDKKKFNDIIPPNKKRQQIYSIISIQRSFFKSGIKSSFDILKYKDRFKEFQAELIADESELSTMTGYDRILDFLNGYLRLVSIIDRMVPVYEKFI